MHFKEVEDDMPSLIYEGYKFPSKYAVFGKTDLNEVNEDNSNAIVYIGNHSEINNLINKIEEELEDFDHNENSFVVVGLWDSKLSKNNEDYFMLATIISKGFDYNPLEYINVSKSIYQLNDNSSSDCSAWMAWRNLSNDYINNILSKEKTKKIANVLLNNISENEISKFEIYENDYFLKSLLINYIGENI